MGGTSLLIQKQQGFSWFYKKSLFLLILEMYVHDIEVGTTVLEGKPEVMNETSATALVDGNNLLGPVSCYNKINWIHNFLHSPSYHLVVCYLVIYCNICLFVYVYVF